MFEKDMRISYLLDLYGALLDERERLIMTSYYEDDLSLSEIADGENISRQGVRHIIKKNEEQLDFFESGLHLSEHYARLDTLCKELSELAASLELAGDSDKKTAESIRLILKKYTN